MVREIDIRYCSTCQTKDFIDFVRFLFFPEDLSSNIGCSNSILYRNNVNYTGMTSRTSSQSNSVYNNSLGNRLHDNTIESFIAPVLSMNFYAGNMNYGFVDRTFTGSASSLLYINPFQFNGPSQIGFSSPVYEEYIIDKTPRSTNLHLVRSQKAVYSSDRMSNLFGLVKPLVSHGSMLYSARSDTNCPITYMSERMDVSSHRFISGTESGTPALFYKRDMSMRKLFIMQPNTLYKTTFFPETNIESVDGEFSRDLYLPPYLHAYAPNSLAGTQVFFTDEISYFEVAANNTSIWSCVPIYNGPIMAGSNKYFFKLKDVYNIIGDVSEFEIYPYEYTHDMKMNLDNKLKYGSV